jgi:hypothetical protein
MRKAGRWSLRESGFRNVHDLSWFDGNETRKTLFHVRLKILEAVRLHPKNNQRNLAVTTILLLSHALVDRQQYLKFQLLG